MVTLPLAPFHSGRSVGALIFKFRTRSPNDFWFLGAAVTLDSFPNAIPVGPCTLRRPGGVNCPGLTLWGFPFSLLVCSPE